MIRNVILFLLMVILVLGIGLVAVTWYASTVTPPRVTPTISVEQGGGTTLLNEVHESATQSVVAGLPSIPPPLINRIFDEQAFRAAAAAMKESNPDYLLTFHTDRFFGTAKAEEVKVIAGQSFTMTVMAVVPVEVTVGTEAVPFWDSGVFTVTNILTTTDVLTTGQVVMTETAQLQATYFVDLCIASLQAGEASTLRTRPDVPKEWDWLPDLSMQIEDVAEWLGTPYNESVLTTTAVNAAIADGGSEGNWVIAYKDTQEAEFGTLGGWLTAFREHNLLPLAEAAGFSGVDLNIVVDDSHLNECEGGAP